MQIRSWHGAVLATALAPSIANAGFIGVQTVDPAEAATFRLFNNRPSGAMTYDSFPDFWATGGSQGVDVWMDFEAPGSAMYLDYDGLAGEDGGGSIRIHGTAAVTDGTDDDVFGHVAIDVLYDDVRWNVEYAALFVASAPGADGGTFTFLETGDVMDVGSMYHGPRHVTLALINLPGVGHYFGIGWLGDDHFNGLCDPPGPRWRFGMAAVPAPGSLALLAVAALVGARRRRR